MQNSTSFLIKNFGFTFKKTSIVLSFLILFKHEIFNISIIYAKILNLHAKEIKKKNCNEHEKMPNHIYLLAKMVIHMKEK